MSNSRRKAFTLTEIMVVCSICALLGAIAFPVFNLVKERSIESSAAEKMHNIGLALAIYRTDWEPSGLNAQNPVAAAGFPPDFPALVSAERLPQAAIQTGGLSLVPGSPAVFTWMIPRIQDNALIAIWKPYYQRVGDSGIALLDETHRNEPGARMHGFKTHHVIGLFLDGHIETRDGIGDYTDYDFWN